MNFLHNIKRGRFARGMVLAFGLAAFGFSALSSAETVRKELVFLHTNDVYEISASGQRGGLARLMTLLEEERDENENTITTFGGDLFSPSVLSSLMQGAQMVDLYNRLGTDYAVAGNHEFDFGPEVAAKRFEESKFTWLSSNMLDKRGRVPFGMKQAVIVTIDGLRVGMFGILEPKTPTLSSPGDNLVFHDPVAVSRQVVETLKTQDVDVIVALAHLEFGEDRALAEAVPEIDLILSGHDHVPAFYMQGDTLIAETSSDAEQLAVIEMHVDITRVDGKEDKIKTSFDWRTRRNDLNVEENDDLAGVIMAYEQELDEVLGEEIYMTEVEIDTTRETVRSKESNFGNMLADAMRLATNADAGLANGGGIRGNRTYDVGTRLTRKDILTELPFGNVTVLLDISGKDLIAALENGVSQVEDRAGRFPQVSNITFDYDVKAKPGKRVQNPRIDGAFIDPAKRYRLATNDYMAGGGDGYKSLTNAKVLIDASGGKLIATDVIEMLLAGKVRAEKTQSRITAR